MSRSIRHVGMWRLFGEIPTERAAARFKIKALFRELKARIDGLTDIKVRLSISDAARLRVREEVGDLLIGHCQMGCLSETTGA